MGFVVSTIFKAHDRISAAFKRMSKNAKFFSGRADKAFKRVNKSAKVFGNTLKALIVGGVLYKSFSLLTMGIRTAGEEFVKFDQSVTAAASKFPEGIKRGTVAFKELETAARGVGATTQFTAADAGRGLNNLAQAGFNAKQSVASLKQVTDLATVAEISMEEATMIATKSLGAFGLKVDDTNLLERNLARVNDTLAYTTTRSNASIQSMFETLRYAGPVLKNSGQGIETFAALTGVMADGAVDASTAGTTLRSAFLSLQNPVAGAAKLLKKHKISVKDDKNNMLDFTEVVDQVNVATAKMGEVQKNAFLETLFGKRAITGMSIVLAKGGDELRKFRKEIIANRGASKKMADEMRKSLQNRLESLKSTLIEVGFKFFEAFSKKGANSIDDITQAIRGFDVGPLVDGLRDIIGVVSDVVKFLWEFRDAIKLVGWVLIGLKMKTMLASGAMWALNAAMIANPAGIVTLAIIALGVALALLITKNDEVVGGWESMFISMEIISRKFDLWFKTMLNDLVNYHIQAINKLIEYANKASGLIGIGPIGPIGDVSVFDTAKDKLGIDEAERRQASLRRGLAGQSTQRAGFRGMGFASDLKKEPVFQNAFPQSDPRDRMLYEGPQSYEGVLTINAPEGSTLTEKRRGAPPLKVALGES